jgi:2-methylcitrate dehydratase PrpD
VQASFGPAARERAAPQTALVEVGLDPAVDEAYPKAWGVRLTVETADGRVLEASRRHAKGDPENPVTAPELSGKALMLLVEGGMSEDRARSLVDIVLDLPSGRPVRDLALFSREAEVEQAPLARSA